MHRQFSKGKTFVKSFLFTYLSGFVQDKHSCKQCLLIIFGQQDQSHSLCLFVSLALQILLSRNIPLRNLHFLLLKQARCPCTIRFRGLMLPARGTISVPNVQNLLFLHFILQEKEKRVCAHLKTPLKNVCYGEYEVSALNYTFLYTFKVELHIH